MCRSVVAFRLDLRRLLIAACASSSLVIHASDFTGMSTVDDARRDPLMSDLARGWTEFLGPGNADGVSDQVRDISASPESLRAPVEGGNRRRIASAERTGCCS